MARHEGTPQGGPLSPLLANLLLANLDKELERRGHRFCRYADDCNIDVRSPVAGERKFLGYRLRPGVRLGIAPASLDRAKDRLRRITRRNRGIPLARMIAEVNAFTTGWVTYFVPRSLRPFRGVRDDIF